MAGNGPEPSGLIRYPVRVWQFIPSGASNDWKATLDVHDKLIIDIKINGKYRR